MNEAPSTPSDFIRSIVIADNHKNTYDGRVHTRFPPEPNGYLHLGHAKSICLNFGIANEYETGKCNLRFDDTNPLKESTEYVDSIKKDVSWLGFEWYEQEHYASDYFQELHDFAVKLIQLGKAYVDDQTNDEIRAGRGNLTQPGIESPYRNRSIEENLALFTQMKEGMFEDGSHVLRAKIDMTSPNIVMRDPVIYRIRRAHHHRTGDDWCIYPMYDFTHCISDSLEHITHSICTLEFVNNRELYDWLLDTLGLYHPQQIEFARLKISNTVLSKRKLIALVQGNYVNGWDDPRMPTISGLRRRGYTPESLRDFCARIGVSRADDSTVDYSMLEFCVRNHLNTTAPRVLAVQQPVKIIIDNYPENQVEWLEMPLMPEDPASPTRKVPFSRELYIEQEDFQENPPPKYFRLIPGREVRLRYAYYITCQSVEKDAQGNIIAIHCTYDPESKGGGTADGRKVKSTLHWVEATNAAPIEVRIYNHLFTQADPEDVPEGVNFLETTNPDSLTVCHAMAEPYIKEVKIGDAFQFERLGYYRVDEDTTADTIVFNRTTTLKDAWVNAQKKK